MQTDLQQAGGPGAARRSRRWPARIALVLLLLVTALVLGAWLFLRGSLASLDGSLAQAGLTGAVSVERDAQGVPTIAGTDRADLAYATGFVHAQDRFFQMDLLRRSAAGELAELVGPAALALDRPHRLHRFRARAALALAALPAAELALLQRYCDGVNAGLAGLRSRPFEYALLRSAPRPWQPADTLLVVWAMYFDLQGEQEARKLARGWLQEHSSAAQLAFLLPEASAFDAPLDVAAISDAPAAIPASAPDWFGRADARVAAAPPDALPGSNNWALAGGRTREKRAIVSNDMHLSLRLPHIWYRAVLKYPDAAGRARRLVGVTLPGAPLVIAGSNGQVAWGYTNSYVDTLDLVELQRDGADPLRFKTATGWEQARVEREFIAVKGAPAVELAVLETSLGPVREVGGRFYAVHWIAHEPGAVNTALFGLEQATDLAAALNVANRAGMPAQNFTAVDSAGHIGWTLAGAVPERAGRPATGFPYAAGSVPDWQGRRAPADVPRIVDPAAGQLWTANSRQLAGPLSRELGDGGDDLGARARQIRDDLSALGATADEAAVYAIALDDRALFMAGWRERALRVLDAAALQDHPQRAEFRRLLQDGWSGRAGVDAVGYRLAWQFLQSSYAALFGTLDAELKALDPRASMIGASRRWPVVIARLYDEQPAGWLPAGRDWRGVQLAAIDHAIARLTAGAAPLAGATWGARNRAAIHHPFVDMMPWLGFALAAPADALPGDSNMPRVAAPAFGQSERMVVSPGHEEDAIFNMPGGQSGHPLSPFFLAGHEAWVRGDATPLLPGAAVHRLTLVPQGR